MKSLRTKPQRLEKSYSQSNRRILLSAHNQIILKTRKTDSRYQSYKKKKYFHNIRLIHRLVWQLHKYFLQVGSTRMVAGNSRLNTKSQSAEAINVSFLLIFAVFDVRQNCLVRISRFYPCFVGKMFVKFIKLCRRTLIDQFVNNR